MLNKLSRQRFSTTQEYEEFIKANPIIYGVNSSFDQITDLFLEKFVTNLSEEQRNQLITSQSVVDKYMKRDVDGELKLGYDVRQIILNG
jgi:hypothetical protein